MSRSTAGIVVVILLVIGGFWYRSTPELPIPLEVTASAADRISEPLQPIPLHVDLDKRKVDLGRQIFHDPHLSADDSISCASCHNLASGGVDGMATSVGMGGAAGHRNAPTVFNSGFNFRQFWDGRAADLEDQIDGPVHAAIEMASNWPDIIRKLTTSPVYPSGFSGIYPDGITEHNIKDAIATFERSLYTPNSPFDQYLRGNASALSAEEQEGYRLFKDYGCTACHQGINVGGNMFQKLGVMTTYFEGPGKDAKSNLGRFTTTGEERDRGVFKVPSLRNVDSTAPYFHDGSVKTLDEAVSVMAKYQLGRILSDQEKSLIVKFLKTLHGQYNGKAL